MRRTDNVWMGIVAHIFGGWAIYWINNWSIYHLRKCPRIAACLNVPKSPFCCSLVLLIFFSRSKRTISEEQRGIWRWKIFHSWQGQPSGTGQPCRPPRCSHGSQRCAAADAEAFCRCQYSGLIQTTPLIRYQPVNTLFQTSCYILKLK